MTQRIAVVEDNEPYAEMIRFNLEREGFSVSCASSGTSGLEMIRRGAPDLVILDMMLPAMSGYTVLQRMRDEGITVPVLVMTARGTEEDKLRGFSLGADDYVVKPCGLRELLARVKALLKRTNGIQLAQLAVVTIGEMTIDLAARTVIVAQKSITLRPKEFDVLATLARNRGRVVSRDMLLRDVFGHQSGTSSRTVETHIATLRHRIGDDPESPRFVVTMRTAGYKLGDG